jgi:hypothetical protein
MNDNLEPLEEEAVQPDEEQVGDEGLDEEKDNSGPVFYAPQEVLSLNVWLNRAAVAGAAVATCPTCRAQSARYFQWPCPDR